MSPDTEKKLSALIDQITAILPPSMDDFDWSGPAFRWIKRRYLGYEAGTLEIINTIAHIKTQALVHISEQKEAILLNTEQFLRGYPANNVLLSGARGTGKSSLIRACLTRFTSEGLRLIEVDKHDLCDLADIMQLVKGRPERFIIYCDDLSFELGDGDYKALKAALDGSVAAGGDNVIVYATSNRRHLMPEPKTDNLTSHLDENGDLHPGEVLEEKLSLSERFGLWLSFYPFTQEQYMDIVQEWLIALGVSEATAKSETIRLLALQFALQRGSRSGRVAQQFARDIAGRIALKGTL